jgi:hypothetical protein
VKKLKQIILEETLATVIQNVNVKLKIHKTHHAEDRKTRNGDYLSDDDIVDVVKTAIPKIAEDLVLNILKINEYILIKEKLSSINIVAKLEKTGNIVDIVVVTVMIKDNFIPKSGTKVVNI